MRVLLITFLLIPLLNQGQELFPLNEPASTVPKNVLGVRLFGDIYKEQEIQRSMAAIRIMYGCMSKLTLAVTGVASNHHSKKLPENLITHTHEDNTTTYQTNNTTRGLNYPYTFNGGMLNAKWRFLSQDGQNTHFRMAAYGEGSIIKSAHDEAEPDLLDDTKGIGGGIITTYLKHHFATSLTTGFILPGSYSETTPDIFGGELHTKITYGRAINYNLSIGYLLFPFKYKSYSDLNVNIYVELMGKSYEAAKIIQNDVSIIPQTDLLRSGNYIDIYLGIQAIINSNLRIDFSTGFTLAGKSYTRFYPVFAVGIQRYFFL